MKHKVIFKRSLKGLNSEFSSLKTGCHTHVNETNQSYRLSIAGGRIIWCTPFTNVLALCEMLSRTRFELGSPCPLSNDGKHLNNCECSLTNNCANKYVNIHDTIYAKKTFTQTLPYFFSYWLPKIYLHIQNKKKKCLMKPDAFDFKYHPAFLLQLYSLHHLIISPHMLLNRKTHETVSVWRSSRWNKTERNITHLNLSLAFDLSSFPHISIILSDSLQIYLFNITSEWIIALFAKNCAKNTLSQLIPTRTGVSF